MTVPCTHMSHQTSPTSITSIETEDSNLSSQDAKEQFPVGTLVWGKIPGYDWWPGTVISHCEDGAGKDQLWVRWFGDNQLSQVCEMSVKCVPFLHLSHLYMDTQCPSLVTFQHCCFL